ncbi:MAG: nitrous oxide reductase accessory protein NosL [Chloroflexota bacterium]
MKREEWQVAGSRWQVVGSRWQVTGGGWQVAGGRWQVANYQLPITNYHLLIALLLLLLLPGCQQPAGVPEPPDITYGQELCDACGMLIDEPRFAAATVLTNGEARQFDDIGDMLAYHAEHPDLAVAAWFVHDYHTEEWLPAETAIYVKSDEIMSPMAHGLAAFADQQAAELLAGQTNGEILTFDKLRARVNNE